MAKKDHLHQLIHALTKSEKRYFKLYASVQKGETQYMQLFDAIAAQEEYDEQALKEEFAGKRFVNQFNVAKKYLYDLILRTLRVCHEQSSMVAQIMENTRTVAILFQKGLTEQATELLDRTIVLATEHEESLLLLEALQWKVRIHDRSLTTLSEIEDRYSQIFRALEQCNRNLQYGRLLDLMELRTRRDNIGSEEQGLKSLEEYLEHPLLAEDAPSNSVKSALLYNWAHGIYHFSRNEHEAALHYTTEQIHLFESSPIILNDYPKHYLNILHNQATSLQILRDHAQFNAVVEKATAFAEQFLARNPLRTLRLRCEVFYMAYWNQLTHFVRIGEFSNALRLAEKIEAGLVEFAPHLESYNYFKLLLKLTALYIGAGHYAEATSKLTMLLNDRTISQHSDIEKYSRFLQIIVQYELGNIELIEYLARSTYRWLRSRKELDAFDSVILRYARKLGYTTVEPPNAAFFQEWETALTAEIQRRGYRSGFFDYIAWIQSKKAGVSMQTAVRELHAHATATVPV